MGSGFEVPKGDAAGAGCPNGANGWPAPPGIGGKGLGELELVTAGDGAKGFPGPGIGRGAWLRSPTSDGVTAASAGAGLPNWLKAPKGVCTVEGGMGWAACGGCAAVSPPSTWNGEG